jgi:hypothetical protein
LPTRETRSWRRPGRRTSRPGDLIFNSGSPRSPRRECQAFVCGRPQWTGALPAGGQKLPTSQNIEHMVGLMNITSKVEQGRGDMVGSFKLQPGMTPDQVRELLRNDFESNAMWRIQKAADYPQDYRNDEAAKLLTKLADSVDDVPDTLLVLFSLHWGDGEESSSHLEEYLEAVRRVGFGDFPKNATEFVRSFTQAD